MSLDLLPVDLLLQIFHQLPFKDRVRLSGVNRSFRDASEESIAKMKSLDVDDLISYLVRSKSFTIYSLLESCSPTVESILASNRSCTVSTLSALAEFVYPKLKHLEIAVRHPTDIVHVKRLISRNRCLRSVELHLDIAFEWPTDIVFENMEKLDIRVGCRDIDLSPALRPLIGMVPNLKSLTIQGVDHGNNFTLSAQDFSQLLATTPSLEELNLDFYGASSNIYPDFETAIPTWHLPKLAIFYVNLSGQNSSSILHCFPTSFPRLESFTSYTIDEIDGRELMVLSPLKHLRELCLPLMVIRKAEIINLITNIPSISTLKFYSIFNPRSAYGADSLSPAALIEFLTSTTAIRRNLEICTHDT